MNVERRQAAADPQTKPNDLGSESACRLPESTPTIAIYYYYSARKLILILTSCGRVEDWVDLGGRLHTEMVYPPADGHPVLVLTGPDVAQLRW